jgi:putative flippase GtrA
VFGYEVIAANLVSVFLAILTNFLINKYWTFRNKEKAFMKQWSGYFVLNAFTFVLNQILTSFFAFRVPIIEALFGNQRDNVAKALAIGCILFLNFFGSKFLIFRKKPVESDTSSIPAP